MEAWGENMESQLDQEYLSEITTKVFNNDLIVDEIVKKLDMMDLKVFRQMDKTSYDKSKRFWLKKACFRIRNINAEANAPLQDFTNFFQECLGTSTKFCIPVESFTLILSGDEDSTPQWETFKQICGPYIKSMRIEFLSQTLQPHYQPERYYGLGRLFPLGFYLPNLKRLDLIVDQQVRFHSLLVISASLEELHVRRNMRDNTSDILYIFSHLCLYRSFKSRKNPDFLKLRTLDTIGAHVFDSESLVRTDFPLQHLALRLLNDTTEVELANVLNHYRGTLESLKLLKFKIRRHTPFVNLSLNGNLIRLKEVELWGNLVTNLDFLRNTPSLMKLKVDYGCFECPHFSGKDEDDVPNVFQDDMVQNSFRLLESRNFRLEMLQVFVTDCKMSAESWKLVTKWMPNLRDLEAPIPDNTAFWNVCDHLEKLQKLRVRFGSQIDDNGVIGHDGDMPGTRGIAKLKYLKSFEVEVDCGQGKLTDRSAELGFLRLPHLGSLKLGFSGNLLTEEMEARLRESIELFEIYRSCRNTTADGKIKRCCQWADFKRIWHLV